MAVETFWRGTELVVTATFRNAAGTLTNPSTVTFYTQSPAGAETSYVAGTAAEATNTSTGVYQLVITPSAAGEWLIVTSSTGNPKQTDRQRVEIAATGIAAIDA